MSGEVFDSGVATVKKIIVVIPFKMLWICNSIQAKFPHKEFSLMGRGEYQNGKFVMSDDYIIPDQNVAGASVDFTVPTAIDELREAGWNVVMHSHPFDMPNFSGSDDETINSNFDCSVLYSLGDFRKATMRVTLPDGSYLQLDGSIEGSVPELDGDVDVSMIHEKTYAAYEYKEGRDIIGPRGQRTLAGEPAYDWKGLEDEEKIEEAEKIRAERIKARGGIACGLGSPDACDNCYSVQCIDCPPENIRYMREMY